MAKCGCRCRETTLVGNIIPEAGGPENQIPEVIFDDYEKVFVLNGADGSVKYEIDIVIQTLYLT